MDNMRVIILAATAALSGCVSNDTLQAVLASTGKDFCQGVCITEARDPLPEQAQDPVEVKLTIEISDGQVISADVEPMGATVEECSKEYSEGCN